MSYYIEYNGESNKGLFLIAKRPSIPSAEKQVIVTEVEGKNGAVYEDLGTYKDIEISIECNFLSKNPNTFMEQYRRIKKYLLNKETRKLKFSDDPEYFYKVQNIRIDSFTRTLKRKGSFSIVFTCNPVYYSEDGQQPFIVTSTYSIFNPYLIAKPIYKLKGQGYLELKINDNLLKANVGTDLTIDVEKQLCYRETGEKQNIAINQNYKNLELKEGDNMLQVVSNTSNISIECIPNWGDI